MNYTDNPNETEIQRRKRVLDEYLLSQRQNDMAGEMTDLMPETQGVSGSEVAQENARRLAATAGGLTPESMVAIRQNEIDNSVPAIRQGILDRFPGTPGGGFSPKMELDAKGKVITAKPPVQGAEKPVTETAMLVTEPIDTFKSWEQKAPPPINRGYNLAEGLGSIGGGIGRLMQRRDINGVFGDQLHAERIGAEERGRSEALQRQDVLDKVREMRDPGADMAEQERQTINQERADRGLEPIDDEKRLSYEVLRNNRNALLLMGYKQPKVQTAGSNRGPKVVEGIYLAPGIEMNKDGVDKYRKAVMGYDEFRQDLKRYKDAVLNYSKYSRTEPLKTKTEYNRIKSMASDLATKYKDAKELGALVGADWTLVWGAIPEPPLDPNNYETNSVATKVQEGIDAADRGFSRRAASIFAIDPQSENSKRILSGAAISPDVVGTTTGNTMSRAGAGPMTTKETSTSDKAVVDRRKNYQAGK